VSWEVRPEPRTLDERAALVAAANQVLQRERESAWWRSGLEELEALGDGPAPNQAWRATDTVEP
jgi:hypothetical protein